MEGCFAGAIGLLFVSTGTCGVKPMFEAGKVMGRGGFGGAFWFYLGVSFQIWQNKVVTPLEKLLFPEENAGVGVVARDVTLVVTADLKPPKTPTFLPTITTWRKK